MIWNKFGVLNKVTEAHHGPEESTPRFGIGSEMIATLNLFEKGEDELPREEREALMTEVRTAFAEHDIALDDEAKVTVDDANTTWTVKAEDRTYKLRRRHGQACHGRRGAG